MRCLSLVVLLCVAPQSAFAWGAIGHKETARLTMSLLTGAAARFYAPLASRVVEHVNDPDHRDDGDERPRHFLDLEGAGVPAPNPTQTAALPKPSPAERTRILAALHARSWRQRDGVLPDAAQDTWDGLVAALRAKDDARILVLTADLSHYVADAHQPLHSTRLYDGLGRFEAGVHSAFETEMVRRCRGSLPRHASKARPLEGRVDARMVDVVLESHALASAVMAMDLGCGKGVAATCTVDTPLKRANAGRIPCDAGEALARERMELAASRTAELIMWAWKDSGRKL